MVERDPFCRAVLAKHWPGVPVYDDARMSVAQWRQVPRVDVLIGGFPCQDVSNAGARAGLSGDRSGLWWCFRRAIRILRPQYVVVENVPGLFARGFDIVLRSLARLGRDAEWSVIRAADVGAPHLRARVFILAHPDHGGRRRLRLEESAGIKSARWRQPDGRCEVWRLDDAAEVDDAEVARPQGHQSEGGEGRVHREPRRSVAGATEWRGWPARPGEAQHEWEPARVLASTGRRRSAGAEPALGALSDGVPADLPGWRRAALQATGNAVVPQVGAVLARRVRELAAGDDL